MVVGPGDKSIPYQSRDVKPGIFWVGGLKAVFDLQCIKQSASQRYRNRLLLVCCDFSPIRLLHVALSICTA